MGGQPAQCLERLALAHGYVGAQVVVVEDGGLHLWRGGLHRHAELRVEVGAVAFQRERATASLHRSAGLQRAQQDQKDCWLQLG